MTVAAIRPQDNIAAQEQSRGAVTREQPRGNQIVAVNRTALRVLNRVKMQPASGRGGPCILALRTLQQLGEVLKAAVADRHLQHRPDEYAVLLAHERLAAD